ncbi:MAG: hypothetical protein HXY41_15280 [Chloroflexi bacterium]|nr:hypothetical protein [Chloroflexota bacterium]
MLNPWNPFSPLRLLLWTLLEPARLADYRVQAGERASKIVGSWLTSSLTWLPMLIPLLGYGLGSIPGASSSGLYLAAVFVLCWLVTGFLGARASELVGFMAGALTFFVILGISFTIAAGVTPGFIAGGALSLLAIVARGLGISLGGHFASNVAGGLAGGVVTATVTLMGGGMLAGVFLAFAVPLALVLMYLLSVNLSTHLNSNIQAGRPTFISRAVLALIPLSLLVLVWLYFLGGWARLHPA